VAILPFSGLTLFEKIMEWFRYRRKSFNEAAIKVCASKKPLKFPIATSAFSILE
jgi:hypothetical protein